MYLEHLKDYIYHHILENIAIQIVHASHVVLGALLSLTLDTSPLSCLRFRISILLVIQISASDFSAPFWLFSSSSDLGGASSENAAERDQ